MTMEHLPIIIKLWVFNKKCRCKAAHQLGTLSKENPTHSLYGPARSACPTCCSAHQQMKMMLSATVQMNCLCSHSTHAYYIAARLLLIPLIEQIATALLEMGMEGRGGIGGAVFGKRWFTLHL